MAAILKITTVATIFGRLRWNPLFVWNSIRIEKIVPSFKLSLKWNVVFLYDTAKHFAHYIGDKLYFPLKKD